MKNLIKICLLIIVIVVIAVGVFGIYGNYFNKQNLDIVFSNNNTGLLLDIYKGRAGDDISNPAESDIVANNISKNVTLHLKNGSYRIVSKNNPSFEKIDIKTYLDHKPNSVRINPSFSEVKVKELLNTERPNILKTLRSNYPNIDKLYTVNEGNLYYLDRWYGTTLSSKNSDITNNDTLRLILEKKDGVWELITKPPDIILSKVQLNNVPQDIIDKVNNL